MLHWISGLVSILARLVEWVGMKFNPLPRAHNIVLKTVSSQRLGRTCAGFTFAWVWAFIAHYLAKSMHAAGANRDSPSFWSWIRDLQLAGSLFTLKQRRKLEILDASRGLSSKRESIFSNTTSVDLMTAETLCPTFSFLSSALAFV
jgi:hypothetical protein